MGRARGTKRTAQPAPGRWPEELRDLQRRGGMAPDWHEAWHQSQKGLGNVQAAAFVTSPYFKDAPEETLRALTRRPFDAAERIELLDYLPPGVVPPLYDPVLQALWRNEWKRLLQEGVVRSEQEREAQRRWYQSLETARENVVSMKQPTPSFSDSVHPVSALWAATLADPDGWDHLASCINKWDDEEEGKALLFIQNEIFGSSKYLHSIQSRGAPLLGIPSGHFYQAVWRSIESSRFNEDSPFYAPDDHSVEAVLAEITTKAGNAWSLEAFQAFQETPLYSSSTGTIKHGDASPVYAFAIEKMLAASKDLQGLREVRGATVARCLLRLLDVGDYDEIQSGWVGDYEDAQKRARKERSDFALGYGDHPLRGWDFLFVRERKRWEDVLRHPDRSWANKPIAGFVQGLEGVSWSGDLESDLLDFLENKLLA